MVKSYAGPVCNGPEARIKSLAITERKYAKLLLIIIKQLVSLWPEMYKCVVSGVAVRSEIAE